MSDDKVFAEGFYFDRNDNAPDFVIGRVSVNVDAAIPFLKEHANDRGYVNLQVKRSKAGKPYMELDTWQPNQGSQQKAAQVAAAPTTSSELNDDIPF